MNAACALWRPAGTALLTCALALTAAQAQAQGRRIPYQGLLEGVTPPASLVVELFDASIGGARVWGPEVHAVTPDAAGRFAIRIGASDLDRCAPVDGALDCDAGADGIADLDQVPLDELWLQLRVMSPAGTSALGPRKAVVPAFHAYTAQRLDPPAELDALADEVARALTPPGTILIWPGPVGAIPEGWLLCDGAEYPRADYPELAALLAERYPGASGTGFRVPDYRGRFLRAVDDGSGRDPDAASRTAMFPGGATGPEAGSVQGSGTRATPSWQTTAGGTHQHEATLTPFAARTGSGPSTVNGTGAALNDDAPENAHDHRISGILFVERDTRPLNAAVHFIIKH